jgi:conjugative relaxase-like TrwC/TraI family protein
MAVFRQTTSRADDPQLHTHAVISAKVQTADGRWLALDARYLKKHQRMLGGLYQSVLRNELTHRLGVEWGPIVKGQSEAVRAGNRHRRNAPPWNVNPRPTPGAASPGSVSPI